MHHKAPAFYFTLTFALGLFASATTFAAATKDDVCHREGSGDFHIINISVKAIPAHRAHGDALPGEAVPGTPGSVFDATCGQISASTCPCDFSAVGLAEVGIDGAGDECTSEAPGAGIAITESNTGNAISFEGFGNCTRNSATVNEFITGLTTSEADDCSADLQTAITELEIPPCS